MEKTLTVVATFLTEIEAEMTQRLLEARGIQAMVQKDICGGMQPQLAMIRGIRVLVSENDVEAARLLIGNQNQDQSVGEWTCSSCGETVAGNFSVCWHCGAECSGMECSDKESD